MDTFERLHQTMEQAVCECEVAGVNLLVEKDGRELYYGQAGMADREAGRLMERDTILRLYSQAKPVTAAAVMILMERGMIDLCQPLSDFIPEYGKVKVFRKGEAVPCETPVRIHDLLNMTSGMIYPEEGTASGLLVNKVFDEALGRLGTQQEMTTMEIAKKLAACPLAHVPGESWHYGTSADILGAVVEAVTGERFGEFLRKEIFEPLGMKDTAFWVPAEKQNRLAAAYETITGEDGSRSLVRYKGDNLAVRCDMSSEPAFEAGGAGLVSTLDDYMRFARMLLMEGEEAGARILQPRTVRFMTGGRLMKCQQKAFEKWTGLEGFTYANLMRICRNPSQSCGFAQKGEYGWDGWLGAYFANFPKERLTILMGIQKVNAGTFTLTRKLRNLILCELT